MAKSKKATKKKVSKKPSTKPADTESEAVLVGSALEALRLKLNMGELQDRSGNAPKFLPENNQAFYVEDVEVTTRKTEKDGKVAVVKMTLTGIGGVNDGKRHVEETWFNTDWAGDRLKTDIVLLGGAEADADFADVVALNDALEAVKGVNGVGDVWPKDEHINLKITGLMEGSGKKDDGEYNLPETEAPAEPEGPTEAEIRAMPEDDDGELIKLAVAENLDPNDYDWPELKDELVGMLCDKD